MKRMWTLSHFAEKKLLFVVIVIHEINYWYETSRESETEQVTCITPLQNAGRAWENAACFLDLYGIYRKPWI